MRLAPVLLAALMLACSAIAAGQTTEAEASPGSVGLLAVDMDITGNSIGDPTDSDGDTTPDTEASTLGTIEDCAQIASGETTQVDIVVSGYPASDPLVGFDITLNYDPAVVNVTGSPSDTFTGDLGHVMPELRTLISADPQSGPILALDEKGGSITLPDTDGEFSVAIFDFAALDPDEDVDGEEVSDGFLARVQLTGVGPGQTTLSLTTNSAFILADEGAVNIERFQWGFLSVDQPCAPQAQPTPGLPSTADSTGGPTSEGAQTPQPGAPGAETPLPGTPGAGPETGVGPSNGQPARGTPVLGGTPVSGAEGGAGGEAPSADEGGGLSTGAWAGIGAGIAAAVLAGSGAGWLALRRRRKGESE